MKKQVEILHFAPERTYTKRDGSNGYSRSIVVSWMEEGPNGRYEQSTVIETSTRLDENKLNEARTNRTQVEIGIFFSHSEYQDKWYPRTKGYLPREYELQNNPNQS